MGCRRECAQPARHRLAAALRVERPEQCLPDGDPLLPDSEDGLRMDVEAGPRTHVDAGTVEEAAHFMTYAFAAYGYLLYIWGKPA